MRVVADERDVLKSQLAAKLSAWYDCRADFWEILPVKRRLTCDETNSQKSARCWIYHFNDSRVDLRESVRFQTRLIADERNSERQLAAEFATSMIMELNPKKVYLSRRDRSLMGEILNSQLAAKLCALLDCRADFWEILPVKTRLIADESFAGGSLLKGFNRIVTVC